jgi:protein O-mannosyl-transferase
MPARAHALARPRKRRHDSGVTRRRRAPARDRDSSPIESQPYGLGRALGIAAGLVALNLFIYAAVYRFQLVNWDDSTYVTENPTVLGGLSWSSAWWALTTGHSPYWHPLTWLSHLLDVTMFGSDAGMYHVTSLVLHIANTLLVFELFRRMTGAPGRSTFVAAVFAAHPLHVESVAWIAERKDVLSTLFWLLTMLAYVGYVRNRSWPRYAGTLVLFALALMSKPMVVTLPAVLLLLDVWPLGRVTAGRAVSPDGESWRRVIVEKVPLFALAFATSVATVIIQHRVGAMAGLDA